MGREGPHSAGRTAFVDAVLLVRMQAVIGAPASVTVPASARRTAGLQEAGGSEGPRVALPPPRRPPPGPTPARQI
eukprot:9655231-Alexandrium_andersonii.AAC.1